MSLTSEVTRGQRSALGGHWWSLIGHISPEGSVGIRYLFVKSARGKKTSGAWISCIY